GLPEDLAVDRHPLRQLLLEPVELSVETCRQLDRVGAGLFLHADDDGRLPAARAFAALEGGALAVVRQIADEHRSAAAQRDDALPELIRTPHASDRLQHVLLLSFGVHTGGRVLAGTAHRVEQLGQRNAVRTQLFRASDDLVLAFRAADRRDL